MKIIWIVVLVLLVIIYGPQIIQTHKKINLDKTIHPGFIESIINEKKSNSRINSLEFNPETLYFSIGYENGVVNIYDASDINHKTTIQAHKNRVSHLAYSKNKSVLASSSPFDPTTKVWNQQSGNIILKIPNTKGPEVFSNDDNSIFMANSSELLIYDLIKQKMDVMEYRTNGVIQSISISSDDQYLVVGTTGKIQLWKIIYHNDGVSLSDRVLGKKKTTLELIGGKKLYGSSDWIKYISFSKDNKHLVSVSRFGGIDVLTVPELSSKSQYKSQLGHIYSAQYYAKENLIISTGTKERVGIGAGFVTIHQLDMGTEEAVMNNLSNLPVPVLIPETKTAIIADMGKLKVLDLM